jgi:predicted DNA binding protein
MQQLTIEIPLEILPKGTIPTELLSKASTIRFLHLGSDGFVFTCRVPRGEMKKLLKFLKRNYEQVQEGAVDVSQEGETMIRVSGQWWDRDKETPDNQAQIKETQKLKALYQSQTYFLRSPEISGNCLRITLVGAPESLKNLLKVTFENAKINYYITKLCGIEKGSDSPLDKLTVQQMRVLRLAYAEGYYNIPREVSTERLARLLKMEKGTAGEHLRRAEKNLMDFLMTS